MDNWSSLTGKASANQLQHNLRWDVLFFFGRRKINSVRVGGDCSAATL